MSELPSSQPPLAAAIPPASSVSPGGGPGVAPAPVPQVIAQVVAQKGALVEVLWESRHLPALLATHLPGVVAGQQVLLALPPNVGADRPALIVAAWPAPGAPGTPPWRFDADSGTLTLEVNRLEVAALNSIVLHCEEARIAFSRDGSVQTHGHTITSTAIETHRIEGGSIELN